MRTTLKLFLVLLAVLAMMNFVACSDDDDDNGGTNPPPPAADPWVGTWLSAGDNVAPLLQGDPFNLDTLRVHFNEDQTVTTEQHVEGGAWTTLAGTYQVTEAATGDIHSIFIDYTSGVTAEQEGIVQVIEGSPDTLKLEVVQTVPDYGFVPRTPETGFGSDPVYGATNIQTYVRID